MEERERNEKKKPRNAHGGQMFRNISARPMYQVVGPINRSIVV